MRLCPESESTISAKEVVSTEWRIFKVNVRGRYDCTLELDSVEYDKGLVGVPYIYYQARYRPYSCLAAQRRLSIHINTRLSGTFVNSALPFFTSPFYSL